MTLGVASGPQPLRPDTVLDVPGGPRIVLVRAPGSPAAAIRLSIRVTEGEADAGAARLLQHLALLRLRGRAAALGIEMETGRTADAAVFSVRGAAPAFEDLAWLLRDAMAKPDVDGTQLEQARAALLAEITRAEEVPADALDAELFRRLAPSLPPLWGTRRSVAGLTGARLEAFWRRAFRRDRVALVVVAPVAPEAVLAALGDAGAPAADAPTAVTPPAVPPARDKGSRPETLRVWYGIAYRTGGARHAVAVTAARLLADALAAEPAVEAPRVELWQLQGASALVARGAAYPSGAPAMIRALASLPARVRGRLSPERVRAAAQAAQRDLLLAARTPWGLADVLGRSQDATGDALSAARTLAGLDSVDAAEVASFLDHLANQSPLRAEIRPR